MCKRMRLTEVVQAPCELFRGHREISASADRNSGILYGNGVVGDYGWRPMIYDAYPKQVKAKSVTVSCTDTHLWSLSKTNEA